MISLKLSTSNCQHGSRGYWKFNITLLDDREFNASVKECLDECFNTPTNSSMNSIGNKWEFFKYNVRSLAIKRSKELKKNKLLKQSSLMSKLDKLL